MDWIIGFIGVFLGAVATISNTMVQNKSNEKLFNKQKEWDKEKLDREYSIRQNELKFEIYNRVLDLDGKLVVANYNFYEFDFEKYETIRNEFYKNFNLLDNDVKNSIRSIDKVIEICNCLEEKEFKDVKTLVDEYFKLVTLIDKKCRS